VPDQPEGPIKISDINRDRVTLAWAPPKDDGGSKIKSYTVERREQGRSMWSKVDTVDASKTSIVATGLSQGKEYFFRIFAENDIGMSKALESKQAVIPKSPFGMCDVMFSPTSADGFFLKF
jgi:titin